MLYILNLHNVMYQLYLKKLEEKKNRATEEKAAHTVSWNGSKKRWTVEAGNFLSAIGFLQALETGLGGYLQQEERGKRYPLACRPFSITWFLRWRRLLLSGLHDFLCDAENL